MIIDEPSWETIAAESVLLKAVSNWRDNSEKWLEHSVERLNETVRVNPAREDMMWVEDWLQKNGGTKIEWFSGAGSAWNLPFPRGKAEGEVKTILSALHETGRLTRQEAVSMIPVVALDVKPGEIVLDLCASPGSKTTQIAEHLRGKGIVLANEISSSRINTLVANVKRHGSITPMITHHDGRFLPNVPKSGFDKILVDAPCTGSATTRKNPDVWKKWLPSGGKTLHKLQLELLTKAIKLAKPGGRIVYSTCSLDPIENEAVISEILRLDKGISLTSLSDIMTKLPGRRGMTEWPQLDELGRISNISSSISSMLSPNENRIKDELKKCHRIWNDDIKAGGFFVAVLEKSVQYGEENVEYDRFIEPEKIKPDELNFPRPLGYENEDMVQERLGLEGKNLWIRGKSILWSTTQARDIWESDRSKRGGRTFIPGKRWRPLRVIHLGLICARLQNGKIERISSKAAPKLTRNIKHGKSSVKSEVIDTLLGGAEPPAYEINLELNKIRGGHILVEENGGICLPVWIGGRVSLMISEQERRILRAKRKLPIIIELEEE